MIAHPRIEEFVARIEEIVPMSERLRIIVGEAMEASAWLACPNQYCSTMEPPEVCSTCDGAGRIRRELGGVFWTLSALVDWNFKPVDVEKMAREKYGEKQEAKP